MDRLQEVVVMKGFAMEARTFLAIMALKPFAPKQKVREIEGWELVKLMREVQGVQKISRRGMA